MNQRSKKIIIAIDGPSGTGKSTTAKLLAQNLGFTYLDTGAMYRAITFAALQAGVAPTDSVELSKLLESTSIDFDEQNQILIDGVLREKEIRGPEVSGSTSIYSAVPEVRRVLTDLQRKIAKNHNSVLDGRDIGTVVFPNADFKFFLVTDIKVRAARRYAQLQEKGISMTLEEVEKNLLERDLLDSSRKEAPLRKAEDAIEIDTTQLSINQQVQKIQDYAGVVACP